MSTLSIKLAAANPAQAVAQCREWIRRTEGFISVRDKSEALKAFRRAENFARVAGKVAMTPTLQLELAILSARAGVKPNEAACSLLKAIDRMRKCDPGYLEEAKALHIEMTRIVREESRKKGPHRLFV